MPQAEKRSIALPPDQARYVESLVASGAYESTTAVMLAAIRALQSREAAMERWVRHQVVPVLGALQPDPGWSVRDEHLVAAVRRQQAVWMRDKAEDRSDC